VDLNYRQQGPRAEAAEELREQAASCRKLARRARTSNGSAALATAADQFDDDARRIDPSSQKHWANGEVR
jgi:hypothetical protein